MDVIWISSDKNVATVDDYGEITAVGVGSANIKIAIKEASEINAVCTITVEKGEDIADTKTKPESIAIDVSKWEMEAGETETLWADVFPMDATYETLLWDSSDESIAIVDDNGDVTAIEEGVTIITVTIKEYPDIVGECEVTVCSTDK